MFLADGLGRALVVTQEIQIRNRSVAPKPHGGVGKKFEKEQGRVNKGSYLDDGSIS